MKTSTQKKCILEYLQTGKTLTPLEALDKFGCFRLGARIHELREEGENVMKEMVRTPGGAMVAQYSLDYIVKPMAPPQPEVPS